MADAAGTEVGDEAFLIEVAGTTVRPPGPLIVDQRTPHDQAATGFLRVRLGGFYGFAITDRPDDASRPERLNEY